MSGADEPVLTRQNLVRYLEATRDTPPHRIFDVLDPHLPASGEAIDLGCGSGRGTLRLLSHGLEVTAVDAYQEALDVVAERVSPEHRVRLVRSTFQDLVLDSYDVVVACFTLFFLDRDAFKAFWPRLVASIRPGGIFMGQFLGPHDDWADRMTTHTRDDVTELMTDFGLLHFEEEDKDSQIATGEPKHWHVFHVIARRR